MVSGGVDSTILADFRPEALPIFVDFGQNYCVEEREAAQNLFPNLEIVEIAGLPCSDLDEVFIPARNLLLASIGSQFADEVIIAGIKDDHCVDKTEHAFEKFSDVLSLASEKNIRIYSPGWEFAKVDLVQRYAKRGPKQVERLLKTFSCYFPEDGHHCGQCQACFRRSVSFLANGIEVDPPGVDICMQNLVNLHLYERERVWSVLKVINDHIMPVFEVDIDGVLTYETEGHDYERRTPNLEAISALNATDGAIVLNTSRRESDRTVTEHWLCDNGVSYHSLFMEKPPAHRRIDDISLQRFSDELESQH